MKLRSGKVIFYCETLRGRLVECIDWAFEAIAMGYEPEHLFKLACLATPYSAFEVQDYAKKALGELGIKIFMGDQAICFYAQELAKEIILNPEMIKYNLRILKTICIEDDMNYKLYYFTFYGTPTYIFKILRCNTILMNLKEAI